MNAAKVLVVWLSLGVTVLPAVVAVAGNPDGGPSPQAPGQEPRFKAGDVLTVAVDRANLMVGTQVIATVPKGQRVVLADVRDSWLGTFVLVNGQKKAGWIATADFLPVGAAPGPQVYTAALPVISTPDAVTPRPTISPAPRDDYLDNYYYGYYNRHETDPNIHVWEPWRHH
jgi:hypothetical protein